MVLAQSLALGIIGRAEVLDLDLTEPLPCCEIKDRLTAQAPPGLEILSVQPVDATARLQVRRAFYRVELPQASGNDLGDRIKEVMAAAECWIERTRPRARRINLRPYLSDLHVDERTLEMALWVTPSGTARPEEILQLLGVGDALDAGLVVERTYLELEDEITAGREEGTAVASPSGRLASTRTPIAEPSAPAPQARPAEEKTKLSPRPRALVPGPLSFES
jgi:radical SAM-linked protein